MTPGYKFWPQALAVRPACLAYGAIKRWCQRNEEAATLAAIFFLIALGLAIGPAYALFHR